jgi:hypothetical protein
MIEVKLPNEDKSYIEGKVASISRALGIEEETIFKITFEEIEDTLGITDESIFEIKSPELKSPDKIRGSIFAHFASPIFRRDTTRKQKFIEDFSNRRTRKGK